MHAGRLILVAAMLSWAGSGSAQVKQVAFTTEDDDPQGEGWRPIDAGVGVTSSAVITTSNMRFSIFSRSGGPPAQSFHVYDAGFPFKRTDTEHGRLFDPRIEYDPIHDRLWIIESEDTHLHPVPAERHIARIHLAVSKGGNPLSLGASDWWIYTDATGPRTAFDLTNQFLVPYRTEGGAEDYHRELITLADLPTVTVDERAVYLTPYSNDPQLPPIPPQFTAIIIIPLTHEGGAKSILAGDRPDESDITIIRLTGLRQDPFLIDDHVQHYAVQEPFGPFEEFENAQFFLSSGQSGPQSELRLGGVWYDETLDQWQYELRNDGASPVSDILDMPLNAAHHFYYRNSDYDPVTPDPDFQPNAHSGFFSSAVLVYDIDGLPAIFATHAVHPVGASGPEARFVVQWYVIDPDLDDFRTPNWQPAVVKSGRLPALNNGDAYHPSIGVTPQGIAFIEYTYSDENTFPQLRRAQLTGDYLGVYSDTLVQIGPATAYTAFRDAWADYADMQADPAPGNCGFWSGQTLAQRLNPNPPEVDGRDFWLVQHAINCAQAEMNWDGAIDETDLYLFNDHHALGRLRADMNRDFKVDFLDYAIYTDAYAKRAR
ncbi:MAG: hypothetical protein ACF8R7_09170 [Phycisphaerales bacterium JB039]